VAVDPMDLLPEEDDTSDGGSGVQDAAEARKSRINNWVALLVAVLATFMGICSVKAGNIAQEMDKQQALTLDNWAWYQAKKVRLLMATGLSDQFEVQLLSASPETRPVIEAKKAKYDTEIEKQNTELEETKAKAEQAQSDFDALNARDDQFDLSEAFLAIAIAMFALTSLTQKRWLFGLGTVPMALGILMGLAGLFNWPVHLDFLAKLLGV
jgi:hypothetical protein